MSEPVQDNALLKRKTRKNRAPDGTAVESGPAILFFSGGSALRGLSRHLVQHTHNSIHLITPFDSGGSSASIRSAFDMPAVGDLRNRLVALADPSISGRPEIFRLLVHRLDTTACNADLREQLRDLCSGRHRLMFGIPRQDAEVICRLMSHLEAELPTDFDLRGASVGNLLIAGDYLENGRQLEPALTRFSRLIGTRGTVVPIVQDNLHLVAELEDGTLLVGQHRITGKETRPITSPIRRMWLTSDTNCPDPASSRIQTSVEKLIVEADLICFPMGSFYTSLVANLLPSGVGKAVANAKCRKVYIPNLGHDPESLGLSLFEASRRLLSALEDDAGLPNTTGRLLNDVLVDSTSGHYPGTLSVDRFRQLGVQIIDAPLVTSQSAPLLDDDLLIGRLLSLV
ncbi:MAG: GAK system CofD-like protein [Lysobacterales bacterium]|jgi:CofD-related protein of GAK system